jgi:hypothetical protein
LGESEGTDSEPDGGAMAGRLCSSSEFINIVSPSVLGQKKITRRKRRPRRTHLGPIRGQRSIEDGVPHGLVDREPLQEFGVAE